MHIKQITISNFRSFKQQPEIQPFSPGTNSVVGRNGSGKSNLFDAVQFALLSPRFFTLRTVRTLYMQPWLSFLYVCDL
jgi:structural maintenance of chromosome 3 (chondroitin sulfate proteoglycan 6)